MTQKFILAITEHRSFGYLLFPYLVEIDETDSYLKIIYRIREHHLNIDDFKYSPLEQQIIRLTEKYCDEKLQKRFIPKGNTNDFKTRLDNDDFRKSVLHYIEKNLLKCLNLIQNSQTTLYYKKPKYSNLYDEDKVEIGDKKASAVFNFHRTELETRYFLSIRYGNQQFSLLHKNFVILVNEPCRLLYQNKLYYFDDISGSKLAPFYEKEYITIPKTIEEKYYNSFILNAIATQEINYSGFEIIDSTPKQTIQLWVENDLKSHPIFIPKFYYDNQKVTFGESEKVVVSFTKIDNQFVFNRLKRDLDWENQCVEFLISLGLYKVYNFLKIKDNISEVNDSVYFVIEWLSQNKDTLNQFGIEIVANQLYKNYYFGSTKLNYGIKENNDWFDIYATVSFDDYTIPFIRLKRQILGGIREYKLPNGKIAILPEAWFARFTEIISFGKADEQKIRLDHFHFNLLLESGIEMDKELRNRVLAMNSAQIAETELPQNLKASLRSYQKTGFDWLFHLYTHSLGGCLADDMGLGKTVQTLALLLKLQRKETNLYFSANKRSGQLSLFDNDSEQVEQLQQASLVVLPVSLVHNWENEIKKFTPSLKIFQYTGSKRKVVENLQQIVNHYDIILTTYGTVRNDVGLLSKYNFFYIILDEGQNIKNPESKIYHAITKLHSQYRLVLTGTPIENSLSDLWAQINFLNRGHLGSQSFFKQHFITPIEQLADPEKSKKLHQLIRPFILRRTKEQVAKDLPALTEETIVIEMSAEQKDIYEVEKSTVRNLILQEADNKSNKHSAIVALQALTKLRQIAIHPKMVTPELDVESGKFNEIVDMMRILVAENHKILVFSSFVKHLNLLVTKIENENWSYSMLIGNTKNRQSVIDDFQADSHKNIFLISLKAGGVGLNLTAADYIFIIDPWWNPAAEMQAISRAHRIGQEKKVFVYRFISEGTIEEKIQLLKEKKSALATEFINAENPLKSISKEAILKLID